MKMAAMQCNKTLHNGEQELGQLASFVCHFFAMPQKSMNFLPNRK
jgi:hypothetical protein